MKKYVVSFMCVAITLTVFAQNKEDVKYRRSSLHMMVMEDNDLSPQYKQIIVSALDSAPWPDKYDKHDIGIASYDILSIVVPDASEEEEIEKSKEEEKQDKKLKGVDKKIEKFLD